MSGILLISPQKIKAFSETNDNVDEKLLLSNVQIAQDLGLQTLLGTKFYTHILLSASGGTLSTSEVTLLEEYIQPYLLWRATWESLPTLWMRIMNKSIIKGNTEQGSHIDKGDLTYLRNIHQNRYEFYSQRMMDYIKNNPGDFPIYYQYSSNDGMKPSKEVYYGGIHFEPGFRKLPRVGTGVRYGGIPSYTDPTDSDFCCFDY